jgi:hypothetical protein
VNRQHLRTDGCSDVHRPAIHADDKVGCAEKPNHFSESGLVEQIYGVAGQFPLQLSDTCRNGCERPHALAKLDDMFGRERLPFASRKRMQNDKGLVAKWRIHGEARRKWKNRPMDLRKPETSRYSQIAQDSMLAANHWDHLVIERYRAFARITDSNGAPSATQSRHDRAAEQSLQIQRDIWSNLAQLEQPRNRSQHPGHPAKSLAWKEHYLVDNRIVSEHRLPTFVDQPCDSGFRVKLLQCCCARESMNDVT